MENVEGRVVLDVLRHALTACNLASFSLVDCCQSLLSRRLEVLPSSAVVRLSSCTTPAKGKSGLCTPLHLLHSMPHHSDTVGDKETSRHTRFEYMLATRQPGSHNSHFF